MKNTVWQIAIPSPLRKCFDYLPPLEHAQLGQPGCRVEVSFGKRIVIGIINAIVPEASIPIEKLKRVQRLIDQTPIFSDASLQLCRFASRYYHYALGEIFSAALPKLLRAGSALPDLTQQQLVLTTAGLAALQDPTIQSKAPKQIAYLTEIQASAQATIPKAMQRTLIEKAWIAIDTHPAQAFSRETQAASKHLNSQQSAALAQIEQAHGYQVFLLQGITGSGKTEVYIEAIKQQIQSGAQTLVLVPEISLTPQTLARFKSAIAQPIVTLHSKLTDKQRVENWMMAKSGAAAVVLGTRSAIFTPFEKLGLIIIDEEHDVSFKQQDRFRYSARDLAVTRAQIEKHPLVLGSATPSFETIHNAAIQKYKTLRLTERAGKAKPPKLQIIDVKQLKLQSGLSTVTLEAIRKHLANQSQVLLYLNRRGFAPALYCTSCAWLATCKRCDAKLTYHQHSDQLICHICDLRVARPRRCPACQLQKLKPLGIGTERLEEALAATFPDVDIIRIDSDSTRKKGALEAALDRIKSGKQQILIGTQMLSKGHDFPNLSLVVIVDADAGLLSPDFFAVERLGQTLIQVAGRAGRASTPGEVYIQTQFPDHPMLQTLVKSGYQAYADMGLSEREQTLIPPFSAFAILRAQARNPKQPFAFLEAAKAATKQSSIQSLQCLGPMPALLERKQNFYHAQLLIQADDKKQLQRALTPLLNNLETHPLRNTVRWSIDVDPKEMY